VDGALVLGLGGTVDYEIAWDAAGLGALARELDVRRADLVTTDPIDDERGLLISILAFAASGTGGERFVASSEIIERFAGRFTTAVTLGGTGVRAGIALDRLGIPTVQHLVSVDDNVRRLLPASMTVVSSAEHDTLDPHLIVQYPGGSVVELPDGPVLTPGANRLIFANDPPNRRMALAHDLPAALAGAGVFLVSGFNTMQDPALLDRRLEELRAAMQHLPEGAVVYYEDAGFYVREFSERIRVRLGSRIDVHGMNEDELQEYVGRTVDLLDPDDVIAALRDIQRLLAAPTVVVHTRWWAVAVGATATRYRDALESAVRLAATRYRVGDGFVPADLDDTATLPRHSDGRAVAAAVEAALAGAVALAAFDLEVATPTTVGLGDTFVGGFLHALAPGGRA
jgi:sugar/nucleoside kinase (ribokinase family)